MKYSLRSLMTLSIRDLALVTVIVTLVVGWWADARHHKRTVDDLEQQVVKAHQQLFDGTHGKIGPWIPTYSAPAPNPPKP